MKRIVYDDKGSWICLSKKEMKEKYPEMGYKILGEVTKKKENHTSFNSKKTKKTLLAQLVRPVGTYKKPFYRVHGYIPDEAENTYIVVKKVYLRMIIVPIIVISVLVAFFFLLSEQQGNSFLDKNAKPFETQIKREDMEDSKILLPGFETLYMDEGSDELYVALANPEGNPCFFQYTIYMEGSKKEIYQSGMIKPGEAVTTVKMPNKMKKGTYKLTIQIQSYSLSDHKAELNGGEMAATLIVLSK